jgi:hypothetical protein
MLNKLSNAVQILLELQVLTAVDACAFSHPGGCSTLPSSNDS